MPGKASQLFMVVLLTGSGCTAHRISLHGFFGNGSDILQVRELIPVAGETTPLPPFWDRGVPLVEFTEKHKPLYLDPERSTVPPGDDERKIYGLESSTLAFYAGHGDIAHWSNPDRPPDNIVPLARVKVGDGLLRYFWLHSCNVLAHGPRVEVDNDFSLPHHFQSGRNDADVFQRWTGAFGSDLRMVCGGSTLLGFVHVGEIWNNLLEAETSVPDAFVLGLAHQGQVPVCLARGGQSPASSALADRTLRPEGVEHAGPNWLHLQLPVRCTVERSGSTLRVRCGETPAPAATSNEGPTPAIETLPVVTTTALPPPDSIEGGRLPLGFERLSGDDSKYHPGSGAVVLIKSRDRYSPLDRCDQVTTWTLNPWALLEQNSLEPGLLPPASPDADGPRKFSDTALTALEMRVESRQDGAPDTRTCTVRSLFLRFGTEVDIGTQRLPIFGPGITFELQRGEAAPELASFSAPRRDLAVPAEPPVPIKPAETAIREAQRELQLDPEAYPVSAARAILGYEEAPLRCRQKLLRPTYEVRFFPTAAAARDHPTVIVRRDARLDSSEKSWECQGWRPQP